MAEYVQIKVKTIIKRLNDVKRQTNYLVCNIEGTGTLSRVGRHLPTRNLANDIQNSIAKRPRLLWRHLIRIVLHTFGYYSCCEYTTFSRKFRFCYMENEDIFMILMRFVEK